MWDRLVHLVSGCDVLVHYNLIGDAWGSQSGDLLPADFYMLCENDVIKCLIIDAFYFLYLKVFVSNFSTRQSKRLDQWG